MARTYQVDEALRQLGVLYAGEHAEHDDHGAEHVDGLIRSLRRFKAREQQEQAARAAALVPQIREAAYELGDGRSVWYDAGDAIRDATDLYTVLGENHHTGSPNLENAQAREILELLQRGGGLGEVHVGTLRKLIGKHRASIDRLRRSKDRDGQDMLSMAPDGPAARIIEPEERT